MIKTIGLSKNYKDVQALIDLNLTVEQGSVYGFIGPNGAGKTTAMSILSTLLAPTAGKAYVGGYEVTEKPQEVRQLIGYMPDFFGVYDNLKVEEYLDFYAQAYFVPKGNRTRLIKDLLELVNLSGKENAYVDILSRGMKQRLGLARCLVHSPQVLILDEPASGLDPRARIELREILKELRKMGKTILISSHILLELTEMCDYMGVIEQGRLIVSAPVEEILAQVEGSGILRIKLLEQLDVAIKLLEEHPLVTQVIAEADGSLKVLFKGSSNEQGQLLKELIARELPVVEFASETANIEKVFLKITQGVAQ